MSSGSGKFRLEVTFVAADNARVAIAVIVIDAGPRKVETIGRPLRSPTTRARTPPISSARDSKTWTSAWSEERKDAPVGTLTVWVCISLLAICSCHVIERGFSPSQIKGLGKSA